MKIKKVKATPEQKEEMSSRMRTLIEFFEMNDLMPSDAVAMTMRFIACTCKGKISESMLVAMFRGMVEDVYKGEE